MALFALKGEKMTYNEFKKIADWYYINVPLMSDTECYNIRDNILWKSKIFNEALKTAIWEYTWGDITTTELVFIFANNNKKIKKARLNYERNN